MNKCLGEKRLALDAKYIVQMVDTWTPIFDLTDKAKNLEILQRTEAQIDEVIRQANGKAKGNFNNHKVPFAGLYYATAYTWQSKTEKFTVDDSCIGYGLCQRQCPVSAIELKDGKPRWVEVHCTTCLGCLHRCPKFSIQHGKNTKNHGQYVNPNVVL